MEYDEDGRYIITWTFDDGNGNSIDTIQIVIVDDITDPEIPVIDDLVGECSASVPFIPGILG